MRKVVAAVDGSETSRSVIDYAIHYANQEKDVEILFLHVISLGEYFRGFHREKSVVPPAHKEEMRIPVPGSMNQGPLWSLPGDEELKEWARYEGAAPALAFYYVENEVMERFQRFIQEQAEKVGMTIPNMSVHLRKGRAYDQIVQFAEENNAELIMIGYRGLSGVERFFLGSVAAKVVAQAPCSVYVHRPKKTPED